MNDDPQTAFGGPDCTCIPFTRQEDPPRYLNRPTDTVDMISGWERGRDCPHHASAVPVAAPPTEQAALRDRIRRVLAESDGFDFASLEPHDYQIQATALLAVLPPPADRAAVLREAADVAARFNSDCQNCAVELEVAGELRRLAAEASQSRSDIEKPWLSDGSRIGRALIWSWSDVGHGEFARGYRAAQEQARTLLTGPHGDDAPVQQHGSDPSRLAAETPQPETQAEDLAAGLPLVQGNCPACRRAELFLGTGGYPTCSNADCPEPDAATTVLEQYANEAHEPEHTWAAELHDPLADEWVPGTRYIDRDRAVNALNHSKRLGPAWKDGTPTERRLVRATTTYTVEPDTAPAVVQADGEA